MIIHSPQELSLYLKNLRKEHKQSQSVIAELARVKQTTISAFENKPESTKIETLFNILSALNLDLIISEKPKGSVIAIDEW